MWILLSVEPMSLLLAAPSDSLSTLTSANRVSCCFG